MIDQGRSSSDDFLAAIWHYENDVLTDEPRILRDGMLALQDRDGANAIVNEYAWGLNLGGGPSTSLRTGIGGLLNLGGAL